MSTKVIAMHCGRMDEGSDIVKLNVGGMHYATTRHTLMTYGENYFSALLSEKYKVVKDGDSIFIDRNGELFALVLDYLRTGELFIPKHVERERVMKEFKFFCIDPVTFASKVNDHTLRDLRVIFTEREQGEHKEVLDS